MIGRSLFRQTTFKVHFSQEDREWVATCDLFPSLSYLHKEPTEALTGLMAIVTEEIADMSLKDTSLGGES